MRVVVVASVLVSLISCGHNPMGRAVGASLMAFGALNTITWVGVGGYRHGQLPDQADHGKAWEEPAIGISFGLAALVAGAIVFAAYSTVPAATSQREFPAATQPAGPATPGPASAPASQPRGRPDDPYWP